MKATTLGHAGLFVETRQGTTILCDPWFGSAFYGAWFPFPDNSFLRQGPWQSPDLLFVSHSHTDHFDAEFLATVDKSATVVLPDFPIDELEVKLRSLGFTRFVRTVNGERILSGPAAGLTCFANSSPADGPMGDSALAIDDGEVCVFNQNDSRPHDLEAVKAAGPYDVHFTQHSGAAWFPMVYRMPLKMKVALGKRKRKNQLDRCLGYVDSVDANFVVPNSGPPCFLDEELFHLNDFGDDPANVFPDQTLVLQKLGPKGMSMLPGSVAEIKPGSFDLKNLMHESQVFGFAKHPYLKAYAKRRQLSLRAVDEQLLRCNDLTAALVELFTPLVERTERIAAGIGGRIVLDWGDDAVALDYVKKTVERDPGVGVRMERIQQMLSDRVRELLDGMEIHETRWIELGTRRVRIRRYTNGYSWYVASESGFEEDAESAYWAAVDG